MNSRYLRTRIKVCGLTREQDINAAIELGVDAIGIVFYRNSKRFISFEQAAYLRSLIPSFVTFTALFVNPEQEFVDSAIKSIQPDLLQFHGDESPDFCASFGMPYMKAIRVGAPGQATVKELASYCESFSEADSWLFDSYTPAYGGSGKSFDDSLLVDVSRSVSGPKLVLSGGLTPATVAERISKINPFAVDVSSAVEQSPGIKDIGKIKDFITAVQNS